MQFKADLLLEGPVIQWEYFVLRLTDNNWAAQMTELNHVGHEGWDLVMVDDGVAYLKRQRQAEARFGVTLPAAVTEAEMPPVRAAEFMREWAEMIQAREPRRIVPIEIGER